MKKIIIIIAILFTKSSLYVSAQAMQEFSGYLGGGFSPLSYQLKQGGTRSGGFGGGVGFGYTYFFDVIERVAESGTVQRLQWGIHSGLGLGFYNAKANIGSGLTSSKLQKDDEQDNFIYHTMISGYTESQNALFLTIPVMAQIQLADQYYAKAGIKAGIPVSVKYSAKDVVITNHGEYVDIQNTLKNAPFAGFGDFKKNLNGDLGLGFSVMLALEAGMRFRLTTDLTLYAGLYFDYGLNSFKIKDEPFVAYNIQNPENFINNSVLSEYTEKANIMAVGIKVRVAMAR